jgi:predicted SnoaL-like aldol condensation-catalyzing enzyme
MLVEKTGIYRARPIVSAVEEKEGTKTVQFVGSFRCTEIRTTEGWKPIDGEQQITAYLNLITKEGKPNEINYRALRESLGWDGTSFASLQREDWNGTEVQIVVDDEEYQGQTKRRVKYINPRDYEGGGQVAKSDTQTIQSLDAKYGSLLRALAGSKANGSPPAAVTSQAIGKDVAWTTFNKLVDAYGQDNPAEAWAKDRRVSVFKEIVRELGDGKDTAKLGPAEWAKIKTEIEERFSAAASGLIPF